MSGKSGRPRKDPIQERIRIYSAAAPLIQTKGLADTTVDEIARAALLSRGGIYHYFRSKEELALYGLDPEALAHVCHLAVPALERELTRPGGPDVAQVVELYADRTLSMLAFVGAALAAAVELGRDHLKEALSRGARDDANALASVLRRFLTEPGEAEELAESIHSRILWAAFHPRPEETIRDGLRAVFRRYGLLGEPAGSTKQEPAVMLLR